MLDCNNELVWLIMFIMFSRFYIQVLDILEMKVLDSWLFTDLAILEWISTWHFKHARVCVCAHFKRKNSVVELGHLQREMR